MKSSGWFSDRSITLIGLLVAEAFALLVVYHVFKGLTSPVDGFMHLSNVRLIMKTFPYLPRWSPYWYFGMPFLRTYSPLSHYITALIGWSFRFSVPDDVHVLMMVFTYLCFSVGAISTYFLAKEMKLSAIGCLSSAILFVTSANLIVYWIIGSYPNVTSVLFSPAALVFFLRSIRKRTLLNIFSAGASFALVFLTYFYSGAILFVIIVIISIVMVVREPQLLFISRGEEKPPRYTLILPKVLIAVMLVAAGFSVWWALPFLTALMNAPSFPVAVFTAPRGEYTISNLINELSLLTGVSEVGNLRSPGLEHFILAVLGCVFWVKERKGNIVLAFTGFITAFALALSPWLRIPVEPIPWIRFQLFFSMFAAVLGGYAVDCLKRYYESLWSHRILGEGKSVTSIPMKRKVPAGIMVFMLLFIAVYPVVGTNLFVRYGVEVPTSEQGRLLESLANPGERAGMDGGYGFNMYTDMGQSAGGSVESMYVFSEYAYTFWYYIFYRHDSRFLQYFAKNYNVRFFYVGSMPGLVQIDPSLPLAVADFNSSLVEFVDDRNVLFLFFGDPSDYSRLFISIAVANPQEIILVYGGRYVGDYSLTDLKRFNVVYLSGLVYRSDDDLSNLLATLKEYVDNGGGLILDTGVGMSGIPEPFPVASTYTSNLTLLLNADRENPIAKDVNFTVLNDKKNWSISYAVEVKDGAEVLLKDFDRPVVVSRENLGKTIWTGLHLRYQVIRSLDDPDEAAEASRLLVNLIRYASADKPEIEGSLSFEITGVEETVVYVRNADADGAIWFKMTYYPGWTARIEGPDPAVLRIFQAGPNMMLIFPERSGDYTVRFSFDKTLEVQIGEVALYITTGMFLVVIGYSLFIRLRKNRAAYARRVEVQSGEPKSKT